MNFKNSTQTFVVILLIIVSGFGGYFAGKNEISVAWEKFNAPKINVQSLEPPKTMDQSFDFKLFWDVYQRVQAEYIGRAKLDAKQMYYGAISGMVASLGDPYTVFLPPKENKGVKEELAGHFDGIGAELGVKDKKIVVIAPLKDSPAEKSGVKPGDWVLSVDGKDTGNWTLPDAVTKIRGIKGTQVKLTLLHEGASKPVDLTIVRDTIVIKSVVWKQQEATGSAGTKTAGGTQSKPGDNKSIGEQTKNGKKVAVITLSRFGEGTNTEWDKAVTEVLQFKEANKDSYKGVIVDVRNNPGGFLTDAVYIASEFLKSGAVVLQENAKGERQSLNVNRVGKLLDDPVIVLINKGSASASEILSGALHDYSRAKLVGEKSFGKGTIQQAEDLTEGAGLHITIAKWLTPNGHWVNDTQGFSPDIEVKPDEKNPTKDVQLERALEELTK